MLEALRSYLWTQSDEARGDDGNSPSAHSEKVELADALYGYVAQVIDDMRPDDSDY